MAVTAPVVPCPLHSAHRCWMLFIRKLVSLLSPLKTMNGFQWLQGISLNFLARRSKLFRTQCYLYCASLQIQPHEATSSLPTGAGLRPPFCLALRTPMVLSASSHPPLQPRVRHPPPPSWIRYPFMSASTLIKCMIALSTLLDSRSLEGRNGIVISSQPLTQVPDPEQGL